MNNRYIIYALLMAVVTYLIRMIPMALIKEKIKNEFIRSFLYYVPFAVLGAMTFPAIFYSTNSILSAGVGCTVAIIIAFFDKGLFTVAVFSCISVYITELFLGWL